MKTICAAVVFVSLLFLSAPPCSADGPVAGVEGKLFGLSMVSGGPGGDDEGPSEEVLFPLYEKSGATVAFVGVDWGNCEARDPGTAASTYDWSRFDGQVFMKSAKAKIAWVGLGNAWADKIKEQDPARYWKLAEAFVSAFAKHANQKGIIYFQVPGNEYNLLGRPDWAQLYVEPLKHIYKAVKAVSPHNYVIAGNLSYGGDDVVQALYDAGAKGNFDVLDIHAYSNDPRTGVDIFQVIAAHRAMARNGDQDKQIFLGEGWGPERMVPGITRKGPEVAPSEAEIDAMRGFVENGYRNMMTERDIYDPKWVLGARFFTMNDNWGGGKWKDRAKKVDENGDGKIDYILLDGYKFPPNHNLEPTFYNGGLVGFNGKPKADLMDNFLPRIPAHRFEAALTGEGPVFNYVVGQPYKLTLTFANLTQDEMKLGNFGVRCRGPKPMALAVNHGAPMPESVGAGKEVVVSFNVNLPAEAANKQVTIIGELDYQINGRKHFTDCWLTLMPTQPFEVTMLPGRAVLDAAGQAKRVGMSVINHASTEFSGKITLTTSPGITANPSSFDARIDANGLEAYMFNVTADKVAAPGHYAVYVDIDGKVKDWVAVEVPVFAKKPAGRLTIDAKLDDWKDAASIAIAQLMLGTGNGTASYRHIGKGMFAYDDSAFYAAFQVDDAKHVQDRPMWDMWQEDSIQMAFDPLMDGARTQGGGYKPDDYEFIFANTKSGPLAVRYQGPEARPTGAVKDVQFAFRSEGGKSYYEIAIPWKELDPIAVKKGAIFGASVLVNSSDGSGRSYVEWGGGIGDKKDPRLFVPVVLSE